MKRTGSLSLIFAYLIWPIQSSRAEAVTIFQNTVECPKRRSCQQEKTDPRLNMAPNLSNAIKNQIVRMPLAGKFNREVVEATGVSRRGIQ